ncbi:lysophospholipid acyltransferase family protein [Psychroflexus aestuariivivens]|uniref:lysophospholipid acyltransferase family protein n=1 Tax=Psychroflexus aestuariivivens TaxID=1795040 RepID=UPI000FD89DAB|nr:lysophospholipid acyltransferase family protein [Psychroflexus aestuariivivens]
MHALVFYLVYPWIWLISILPFRVLYFLSDCFFILIYRIFAYRKKVVLDNLNLAFPEKTKKEKAIIARDFYKHFCDIIFESFKSLTISEEEIKKRFVPVNIEEIQKIENEGNSVIIMMAHYANWEWIFIMQRYVKSRGYGVYKRLRNKYFDKLVKKIRAKYNTDLITTKETIPILLQGKAKNETSISGFISDQSPKINKAFHWQKFMGIEVPVHTGAEMLAKKLNTSVVFCSVSKIKRGHYEARFKTIAKNPRQFADYEITDHFLKLVERQIKSAPEYYLWTHKRWKHAKKSKN